MPEAYRQKFRNCHKIDTQTYTEYASEKDILFARWCRSQEISEDFEKLSQLILIEEFKRSIPHGIKVHLDEQPPKRVILL